MKASKEYKDSGIPWFGKLPEEWKIEKLSSILKERSVIVADREFPPLSVTKGGVLPQIEGVAKTNNRESRKLVRAGDFVINSRSDRKGSAGVSPIAGSVSLINIVAEFIRPVSSMFFHYLLRNYAFQQEFYRYGHGIVADLWTTRYKELRNICVPFPPLPVQELIAAYLDKKCAEIDELISRRHAVIERLKELKQSIIVSAVTRGLDPDVPMKDSGIPWLGMIPTHWKTQKFTSKFRLGKGLSITKADLRKSGARVINYGQIHSRMNNGVDVNNVGICYVDSCYIEAFPKALVHLNDILFADTSEDIKGIGNCVRISCNTVFFAGYHTIIASNKVKGNTKYEAYLFQSENWRNQLRMKSNGVKVFSISKKNLRQCYLINPPEGEKEQIVTYLDNKCAEIDALVARQEQIIGKLKELKVSTIAHVVTGKVDVRDAI